MKKNEINSGFESSANGYERGLSYVVTAKEMLENDIREVPMLWGHLIPKNGIALLSGNSDTGKSSLMRQFGCAVVKGEGNFLSLELFPDYGSVIYVSTEDDYYSLSARFKMEYEYDTTVKGLENFRYIFNYKDDKLSSILDDELRSQPADCVIIDALGDVIPTDPNNIINVRNFYSDYQYLTKKHGCPVIFVHHNRKSSDNYKANKSDVSGSQALEAKPRAVLMLSEIKESEKVKELKLVKANYVHGEMKKHTLVVEMDGNGLFRLSDNSGGGSFSQSHVPDHDLLIKKKIKELKKSGCSTRDISSELKNQGISISKSSVARKLNDDQEYV